MNNQQLLTVKEVAEFLKVKERQVYRYMRDKTNPLPYIAITNSTRRVEEEALTEWLSKKTK